MIVVAVRVHLTASDPRPLTLRARAVRGSNPSLGAKLRRSFSWEYTTLDLRPKLKAVELDGAPL